ncbi:MAG: hypothetical protein GXO65_03545 [Euryarchaeota archaeon]|nr:hypothetical protein [Euryarchaeota archaeon]
MSKMTISIKEVSEYLREFGVPGKRKKKLGESLLGSFEGALPKGKSSTEAVRELREPRYG